MQRKNAEKDLLMEIARGQVGSTEVPWSHLCRPSAPDCHLETPAQLLPSCDGCRAGRAQAEIPAPGVSAEI